MTTETLQTTAVHSGFAGVTGPNRGSMMTTTMTTIRGHREIVPHRHAVGAAADRGPRRRPSHHPPWPLWRGGLLANLRHGRALVSGAACRRRSGAVRRRLHRRRTARVPARRPGRPLRGRHPPRPGGAHGRHGVHVGGVADANRHRSDLPVHLDARRSPRTRCDSRTAPRRRSGLRDVSHEPPTRRRCGRMGCGSCRSARHRGARSMPRWAAARCGHPRGVLVPGHRGGRDVADGRDGRRPPRRRLRLREIRRSRCGGRQTVRQRGRPALHRGGAAAGLRRGEVVGLRRGAAADLRLGVAAAARTVRPSRHLCDGDAHCGFHGRPPAPCRGRPVPPPAAVRVGEPGVGRAEVRPSRSRRVRRRDHPRCPSAAAAAATWAAAASSHAAPEAAAAGEERGGKSRRRASRRAIRRARPTGRGDRDST